MNEPTPVVMPSGVWNPNYQPPDLGGSAYTNMANSVSKSMMEGTADLKTTLQNAAGTHQLLQSMGNMKNANGQPMLDPDMMSDIASKGLPAQQKFLGIAASSIQQQMQAQNEQSAQQNMLKMYQQQPGMLNTKLMLSTTPGQRPPMPQGPVNQPTITQNPAPQQTAAPKFQVPANAAANGYYSQEVQHNGKTVHALLNPQGQMVNVFNPDGTIYNP